MFIKYCIEIYLVNGVVAYTCTASEQIYYCAKFRVCGCGTTYTEPIVSTNGSCRVYIFVQGLLQTGNKLEVSNVLTDQELVGLIENISAHHNTLVTTIYHTVDLAKHILTSKDVFRFNNFRCLDQDWTGSE